MKRITLIILYFIIFTTAKAVMPADVVFKNEISDTTKINTILSQAINIDTPQQRISEIAMLFLETPYVANTLEGDTELLRVNLDEMDCTTFVETVMALAYTAGEKRQSWHDFIYNLERLRYRGGELNGYASRLHYVSDWIVDNVHRGNFIEATNSIPGHEWMVKTLDFMSSNADKYPALSNPDELTRIKNYEIGYRNHRYPYIRSARVNKKEVKQALQEGDIVAIVTKTQGLDVSHMGIIHFEGDVPHLLHASSKKGKIIVDTLPLYDYLTKNRHLGIRIIRLTE